MHSSVQTGACCCSSVQAPKAPKRSVRRRSVSMAGSVMLSVLLAFFPKCPMCWAVYMSLLGSFSLSGLAYPAWLLPVLLSLMALHLALLFRKGRKEGYLPFLLSLAGTSLMLCGRFFFPRDGWMLLLGLAIVVSASLFHGFVRLSQRAAIRPR